jgi:hypothetical protein
MASTIQDGRSRQLSQNPSTSTRLLTVVRWRTANSAWASGPSRNALALARDGNSRITISSGTHAPSITVSGAPRTMYRPPCLPLVKITRS